MKFKTLLAAIVGIVAFSANAMGHELPKGFKTIGTDDGRFGTKCTSSDPSTDQPVCPVPFPRLIAQPERYNGKYISLIGFLVLYEGVPILYPSDENFRRQTLYDNVYIGKEIPTAIASRLKTGAWVRVVGKFDATYIGRSMSLGAIWHVSNIRLHP